MIVVDTSVWVDFFRDRDTQHVAQLSWLIERDAGVGLTDVVLAELLNGARDDRHARDLESRLGAYQLFRLRELEDFRRSATLYRRARASGHTIRRVIDCLIASVCIREGVPILHNDADFDRLASCTALEVVSLRAR